ncbi:hypothetical protein C1A50_2222 [Paenibacillus polymyxa]|nr:hypothetical protein C1A50_2222 [Paenibacillus polymyxa]
MIIPFFFGIFPTSVPVIFTSTFKITNVYLSPTPTLNFELNNNFILSLE